jgi:hypothetical protein
MCFLGLEETFGGRGVEWTIVNFFAPNTIEVEKLDVLLIAQVQKTRKSEPGFLCDTFRATYHGSVAAHHRPDRATGGNRKPEVLYGSIPMHRSGA